MNDLKSAIDQYLNRGFGSMNKTDFELWIFNYLLQQMKDKSNYEISIMLRIPEQKVKKLKYDAWLKYGSPNDEKAFANAFQSVLCKAVLKKDGSIVKFVVEDIQLRKYLDSILKKDGRFSDTSFNSEIVSIDADDLEYLMKNIWPQEWESFDIKAKKCFKTDKVTFKTLFNKFTESMADKAGGKVTDLTFKGILYLLNLLF